MKAKLKAHDKINWSAVLREYLEDEVEALETKNIAHAVAMSERLSQTIDPADVATQNTADLHHEFRTPHSED